MTMILRIFILIISGAILSNCANSKSITDFTNIAASNIIAGGIVDLNISDDVNIDNSNIYGAKGLDVNADNLNITGGTDTSYKKETEEKIKEQTKATIRCIPLNQKIEEGIDIFSGKPAQQRVLFARAY